VRFTIDRYPHLERSLRELAVHHREFQDEPLHLALLYDPGRDPRDVFLFELLGNFGRNAVGPEPELFEVTFGATEALPLSAGQRLHLVLTNPVELKAALAAGWPSANEVREAVRRGDIEVLFEDDEGRRARDEMLR
jgi:hypothetical protein